MRDAFASVYSPEVGRRLRALIRETKPDLVHMHLIYHQLTLSVVDAINEEGLPNVMTLHDYKIGCPAYTLYRDGKTCELCVSGKVENVVRHRCIKGSLPASVLAAAEARLARQRRTYHKVDGYIAPSAFAGNVATASGINPRVVHVVPNFLPPEEIGEPTDGLAPEPRFFFAGRLEALKGLPEMLAAYNKPDPSLGTLVIAGAGGELEADTLAAAERLPNVEYLGRVSRERVFAELRRARALLMPVSWHENNPMSLLEARAVGVPVICTEMGGLPEMVTDGVDGLIVPPRDVTYLAAAIRRLANDRTEAERMGRAGNARLLRDNTSEAHYARLMDAYTAAIATRAAKKR